MPRYEIRFYDARDGVSVAVTLGAVDGRAAETAARMYLRHELTAKLDAFRLTVGAVIATGEPS